jgi:hypothetical protein
MSALIPSELLGLPADDGEDALIAGRFPAGGEYAVECLSHACSGCTTPDAPADCLVNDVQIDTALRRREQAVHLGMPAFPGISGRSVPARPAPEGNP